MNEHSETGIDKSITVKRRIIILKQVTIILCIINIVGANKKKQRSGLISPFDFLFFNISTINLQNAPTKRLLTII